MVTRDLVVILDAAHGEDVPGKQSPDGTHREYLWSRKIISYLNNKLPDLGFRVEQTNPSNKEIGLSKRKEIANQVLLCNPSHSKKFLISFHNNGSGDGTNWGKARGYEIYTTKGQTISDKFAEVIMDQLAKDFKDIGGIKKRVDLSDGDQDKEANFTVLTGNYPAVLIEWLFQDNEEDLELLKDDNINQLFASSIIKSLMYIDEHLDLF